MERKAPSTSVTRALTGPVSPWGGSWHSADGRGQGSAPTQGKGGGSSHGKGEQSFLQLALKISLFHPSSLVPTSGSSAVVSIAIFPRG